ncbi:Protein of unknown function [Bacillus cereus]|nr:Protein of unknown function [Bacillus cereus]SCN44136.1 Protein of unknown function [Bacillus wiedmannii]
MWNIGLYKK